MRVSVRFRAPSRPRGARAYGNPCSMGVLSGATTTRRPSAPRRARDGWEATEMDIEESKGFGSRLRTRRSGGRAPELPGCPVAFQNPARHIGPNCRKVPVATAFEVFCARAAPGLSLGRPAAIFPATAPCPVRRRAVGGTPPENPARLPVARRGKWRVNCATICQIAARRRLIAAPTGGERHA